jgi:signal peptidase I
VGLPRETLQIFHGDILTRPEGKKEFEIQRKPPAKVQAMQHVVYDNDYVLRDIISKGWPLRWQSTGDNSQAGMWQPAADFKSFTTDGKADEVWLRYSNFVPEGRVSDRPDSPTYWDALRQGPLTPAARAGIRAQLITDFYGYNTGVDVELRDLDDARKFGGRLYMHDRSRFDPSNHWVGDLALECELQVLGKEGEVVLELVEGGRAFQCRLDLSSGKATLSGQDLENFHPQADTPVRGPGTYRLQFANVDDQLLLWVDGKLVSFGGDAATYKLPWHAPTNADLAPVGIAARKARVEVTHLRVLRDVYYIADMYRQGSEGPITDHDSEVEFTLEADQFLALGDNSPRSKDSRLWPREHYVKRDLLIGKAMFIYWPHALDHIPGTSIWFPFFPNFGRMKFIR